jgi:lipoyl(octanoyl) transferase
VRRTLFGVWLGRRRYDAVHELQRELVTRRRAGEIPDVVLLLEHEPVITLGRGAHAENILMPREILNARGIDVVETGRGGDVTLHAPGQLVAYPIVNLSPDRCDVRRYVNDLSEVMRALVAEHGVASGPVPGLVGLWVDTFAAASWNGPERAGRMAKIGAIGVRISRWVTMHGFALNLSTDLELFGLIVPCGITAHGVTSLAALTGSAPEVRVAGERALQLLAERLDADVAGYRDLGAESTLSAGEIVLGA